MAGRIVWVRCSDLVVFFTLKRPNIFCIFLNPSYYRKKSRNELSNWISSAQLILVDRSIPDTRFQRVWRFSSEHFTYRLYKLIPYLQVTSFITRTWQQFNSPLALEPVCNKDSSRPQLVVLQQCIAHHDVISSSFVSLTLLTLLDV